MVLRATWIDKKINIIAINDLTDNQTLAHLLKYDSVHGEFKEKISADNNNIIIGSKKIKALSIKDPKDLPWKKLKIDVVIESTGRFTSPKLAKDHITAGAKKVLISAPLKCDKVCPNDSIMLVYGVNEKIYNKKTHNIISNASCTTNCVAPILKILDKKLGIKRCYFSTIHAYTSSQKLVDLFHKDLRRSRAAAINIIPTSTGADLATVNVLPKLSGKIKGMAYRIPIANGSVTDFTIEVNKETTPKIVNKILKDASKKLKVIEYSDKPLVSTDIIGNPHSAIFDSQLTKVLDKKIVKLVVWYDNEWGYSNRLVDMIKHIN